MGVTKVLEGRYRSVTKVLQGCYKGVTRVLPQSNLHFGWLYAAFGHGNLVLLVVMTAVAHYTIEHRAQRIEQRA
jgi:hypothetical protein